MAKKQLHAQVLVFLFFQMILHSSTPAQSIDRLDGSRIQAAALDKAISDLMRDAGVQGLGLSIFQKGKLSYQRCYGYKDAPRSLPLTPVTNIYGASLSKALFSVIVMKLVETGVLDLDKPLQDYLPQPIYNYKPLTKWHDHYDDLKGDSLYRKITARMCLAHTSGFPNWRWFEPDQKLRVKHEPGTKYLYSGEGMVYLQVVLERLLNKSLEDLATAFVFNPLGLKNSSYTWQQRFEADYALGHTGKGTTYEKDKDNEARAPSTLETTLADYSKFLEAVLNHRLISAASTDKMFSTQIRIRSKQQFGPFSLVDTSANDAIKLGYGLGWGVFHCQAGRACFKEGHGDGFQHYAILFPDKGTGVLLMSNSDNAESIFKALLLLTIGDSWSPWYWLNYIPQGGS